MGSTDDKNGKEIAPSHYVGHRQRLRDRFLRVGFDGLDDYEAIELLLTFFVPRRDVKQTAKLAVTRFGSFRGVVDADERELAEIEGIGPTTAANLKLVRLAGDHYLKQQATVRQALPDPTALYEYCRSRMGHLATEEFRVFYLDTTIRIIDDVLFSQGTVDKASVFPREVVNAALRRNAAGVIVAHNHPSGDSSPSEHDKLLTRALALAATTVDLKVHDHLIVAADDVFSFRSHGLL